jgi:hydrogenase nickel incorporation protein HypA/HybF
VHELSITRNIVAIVADRAQGRKVRRVTLEVGKLSGVMTDAIAFCFDIVTQGTMLEGAVLDITVVEGRARCVECGKVFGVPTLYAACVCGSRRLHRLQGEELKIKTMELEEAGECAEPAAAAARRP